VEIEFSVLGPPELRTVGRDPVTVSPQLWCVLVSLLVAPNVAVSAEALIDRLWGDDPPAKARPTIRSYIWRIDRILAQAQNNAEQGGSPARVSRRAHGYALETDRHCVDLFRFRALKGRAESLAESGEVWQAAELLREAEAIWRGRALAGLPGDWIGRQRESLEEEHRAATFRRIELELALGRHAALLAELAVLVDEHPLNEDLTMHWMKALFRTGRQADALRAYRDARTRLARLGIEPGPELAELQQRILRHDPGLAITPAYRRADLRTQPDTLPTDIRDFTGRAEEMRLLTEQAGVRGRPALWVIEGTGGVGKTALSVHAGHQLAQQYPDARLFLNFRAHDQYREPLDPADSLRELLTMLDVPAMRIPVTLGARAELWRAELACRRAVVILDDVTGPEQIGPLLPEAGECLVIVTARQRHAGWGNARTLALRVLAEDDATVLFTQIAGRAADHDPEQVMRISRLCGCLPLAIRLAASRVRSGAAVSLPDLADELSEPARHGLSGEVGQQIQASLDLSHRRLTEGERRFFRYLGISPCLDFTAHSAAFLTDVTVAQSRAALSRLADHHLVEEISPGRFGMHDLLRAFAAARSADEDRARDIRYGIGHLADYYLRAVTRASQVRRGVLTAEDGGPSDMPFTGTSDAATMWLESEWGNALRVAEQCARQEFMRRCADLVHALGQFLDTNGHWDDALAAHLIAVQACRDLDDQPGVARSLLDLSLIYLRTGRTDAALQHAVEAAGVLGALGDHLGKAFALNRIGIINRNTARFRDALAYHQEALDIYRAAGDSRGLARTLVNAGSVLWYLGRLQEGMSYLDQALDIYRESNDLNGQAAALNNMGTVQHLQGYHRDAIRCYQASRDIFREIGGRRNLALADQNLARVQHYKGKYESALVIYRRVLSTYRSLGDPQHQAYALADIGSVYLSTSHFDDALRNYEQAVTMAEQAGDRYACVEARCGMAEAYLGSGQVNVALENYERAARQAGEIESPYLKAKALNGIADIVLHTRGADAARIYWREAYDIFAQIGVPEAATLEIRLHAPDLPAS
jgi:DNA-binding SARP family transcriptional activator/tetratricopeptide (TPR) repeat protein